VERVEGTVTAQKVLSAVVRLQERFGAGYVIDFLRGANTAKMQDRHKTIKTFGIGADTSREEWSSIIRDLLAQGYLTKSDGTYPVLKITEKCEHVLKGTEQVMLIKSREKIEVQERQVDYETILFQQLKDLRRQLALDENVPAYVVLSDATLLELATYLPHSSAEFDKISGFGEVKIKKYSKSFGEVIQQYCKARGLASRVHLKSRKRTRREKPEQETETKKQSFELFKQGHPIEKIAVLRGITPATVDGHLSYYVRQGKIDIEQLLDHSRISTIKAALDKIGTQTLTPVKDYQGDDFSFGEIRLVVAHRAHLAQQQSSGQHSMMGLNK
jgi:ATP-dependent DNA helicase RecQ